MRVAQRELLRDAATERHAEHIRVGQTERVEEVRSLAGQPVRPQRDEPGR